jgi:hypothetical protein
MVESTGPSQYMRKALKEDVKEGKTWYTIYGILYDDDIRQRSSAVVAEESGEKAINELERVLVEEKGYEHMKGQLNADAINTGYKSSKKGLIFAFDKFSNSLL